MSLSRLYSFAGHRRSAVVAGVAMATASVSVMTGVPVRRDVAMTG
jgi:ATP-dependent Lon protease